MELVSANTKNYLFLTLTQNNDTDGLVRARVSMRRDQAFWEGGNSFIACESFRITSAPNEGGLYYQQVPEDFVISADLNGTTHPSDPTWDEQQGFGPPGMYDHANPARPADRLISPAVTIYPERGNIHPYAHVDLGIAKQDGTSLEESRFFDLTPRLVRYLSTNRIGTNSKIQVRNANGASADIQLANDPSVAIHGPGGGPDGMFIPTVEFLYPQAAFARFGQGTNSDGCRIRFKSNSYAGTVGAAGKQEIANMVGKGSYLTPRGSIRNVPGPPPVVSHQTKALFDGAMFQILAPTGLETDIPNAKAGGHYRFPIQWDTTQPLKVGDTVYQITDDRGTKVSGKVTAVGALPQYASVAGIDWTVDLVQTGAAGGVITAANMTYPQTYELLLTDEPPSRHYKTYCAGPVTKTTPFQGPAVNGVVPAPVPYVAGPSAAVYLANNGVNHTVTMTRGGEARLVYTPNELYNMFNKSGNGLQGKSHKPPWLLQTDENGGFCIKWDMTDDPASSFTISKAMCDSLGLNDYMEYDYVHVDPAHKYTATLLDKTFTDIEFEAQQHFSTMLLDMDAGKVFTVSTGDVIDPTNNANGNPNWAYGSEVSFWGTNKTYYLVDIQEFDEATGETVPMQLKGRMTTLDNGQVVYNYSRLPTIGQISNTGQISVESWGTFSMINLVIPNIPFQSMLGGESDARILASLRLPFEYGTANGPDGQVKTTEFDYYGDLLYNSDSSRSYLRITTDQQLFDCDVEARLIRRDGSMEVMQIPYKGQFQVKLRLLQTQ